MPSPDGTKLRVKYRLLDTDPTNPLLTDDTVLDEAIVRAVRHYSQDSPREVVEDETGLTSPYLTVLGASSLLASWLDGFSQVQWIDYPAGTVSATYTPTYLSADDDWDFYEDASKTYLRLGQTPTASETVRICYTAPHSHTETSDTIPANDLDAVCDLAAHYACLMLATKMAGSSDPIISADSTNYRDGQLRYKQQAEAWLTRYRDHMGQDEKGGVAGASANADWDARLQSTGQRFLTHGMRWR